MDFDLEEFNLKVFIVFILSVILCMFIVIKYTTKINDKSAIYGSLEVIQYEDSTLWEYNFEDFVLKQSGNIWTYEEKFAAVKTFNGQSNSYDVIVNNRPCVPVIRAGALDIDFKQNFYNVDGGIDCSPVLKISMNFYDIETIVLITYTNPVGTDYYKYIQTYLMQNSFNIRIIEKQYTNTLDSSKNNVFVWFMQDNELLKIVSISSGSLINPSLIPYIPLNIGESLYWLNTGNIVDLENYKFIENTYLYAEVSTNKYLISFKDVFGNDYGSKLFTHGETPTYPTIDLPEGVLANWDKPIEEASRDITYTCDYSFLSGYEGIIFTPSDLGNNINTVINQGWLFCNLGFDINFTSKVFGNLSLNTSSISLNDNFILYEQDPRDGDLSYYELSKTINNLLIYMKEFEEFSPYKLGLSVLNTATDKYLIIDNFFLIFVQKTAHTVEFISETSTISESVLHGDYLSELPNNPIKNGYAFKGWSLSEDGEIINTLTYPILEDTNFYAVFEIDLSPQWHTVVSEPLEKLSIGSSGKTISVDGLITNVSIRITLAEVSVILIGSNYYFNGTDFSSSKPVLLNVVFIDSTTLSALKITASCTVDGQLKIKYGGSDTGSLIISKIEQFY